MITQTEITFMTFVISSLSLLVMQKKQKYSETFIINDEHEQHRWGLPDILGHGGGMVGEVEDRGRERESQLADWVFEPSTHGTSDCYQVLWDKAITARASKAD